MIRKNLVLLVDNSDLPGREQILQAAGRVLHTLTWSDKVKYMY